MKKANKKLKSEYYLGVDGGATGTTAVIIDNQKKVIGQGSAPGANWNVYGIDKSCKNLSTAIEKSLINKKIEKLSGCLAIAGVNTEEEKNLWRKAIRDDRFLLRIFSTPPLVVNDTVAALRAGTDKKNSIVVISGTGSNCWGKNEFGNEAKSGGGGHLLGDEGSAYAIGLAVLKAIFKSLDGRGQQTALKDLFFEKHKVNSKDELVLLVYDRPWDKVDIAKVAPIADFAASGGDKVAQTILAEAAEDLVLMAKAVGKKLGFLNKSFAVVTSGRVFENSEVVSGHFKRGILKFNPSAKIIKPSITSAQAAALLAWEFFG